MRICIVYDCLYPYTIGGGERWYRNLAERISAHGHDVTYVTSRQWGTHDEPDVPGIRVVAVSPRASFYTEGGRRRILPPVAFGLGVFRHLLRRGADYDVVHTASFPYFPLLAAGALRQRSDFRLLVDWHELWTQPYWREYLGPAGGRIGWEVQRACLRVPQRAFCFSRLHERRLRESGLIDVMLLEGQYTGELEPTEPEPAEPVVVFAGRLIPEKRVTALVPALAGARQLIPGLRGEIFGDGPEHEAVVRLIAEHGLDGHVVAPGFVDRDRLERSLGRALCFVLPSQREGYGLVVIEASAKGIPAVVVQGPDNAAVELIEDGVNGVVASSAAPQDLAAAILRVHDGGDALRRSTADWFRKNARRLSLESSLERVLDGYADA